VRDPGGRCSTAAGVQAITPRGAAGAQARQGPAVASAHPRLDAAFLWHWALGGGTRVGKRKARQQWQKLIVAGRVRAGRMSQRYVLLAEPDRKRCRKPSGTHL
jgi:hypothetical protein